MQITISIENNRPTSTITAEIKIEHIKHIEATDPILVVSKTIK